MATKKENKISMFDSIMSRIGFLEVEQSPQSTSETTSTETSGTQQQEPVSIKMESGEIAGILDSKMKNQIEEELSKENRTNPALQGIDFFEYKKGLAMAQGSSLKERAIFAFNQAKTFSSDSLTTQHLLDTSKIYMEKLNEEAIHFQKHVDNLIATEVGAKETEINSRQKENARIDEEIQKLQETKAKNIEFINQTSGEVHTMRRNIEQNAANFKVTFEKVQKEHQEAIDAINLINDGTDSQEESNA